MSQENVDRFREATEALNRRDLEGWLSVFDEEVVFEPRVAVFEGSFTGHDGLRRFFESVVDSMELFEVTYDEVRDLDDRLLALGTDRGRGKESGAETAGTVAIVASFRDGKVVHFKDYGDRGAAVEAAGLDG